MASIYPEGLCLGTTLGSVLGTISGIVGNMHNAGGSDQVCPANSFVAASLFPDSLLTSSYNWLGDAPGHAWASPRLVVLEVTSSLCRNCGRSGPRASLQARQVFFVFTSVVFLFLLVSGSHLMVRTWGLILILCSGLLLGRFGQPTIQVLVTGTGLGGNDRQVLICLSAFPPNFSSSLLFFLVGGRDILVFRAHSRPYAGDHSD